MLEAIAQPFAMPTSSGPLVGTPAKDTTVVGFTAEWSTSVHFRIRAGSATGVIIATVSAGSAGSMGEYAVRSHAHGGVYVEVLDNGGGTLLGSVHVI